MYPVRVLIVLALVKLCHGSGGNNQDRTLFFSYEARSEVIDHATIDLDQKEIIEQVMTYSAEGFMNAFNVYNEGAHSRPYANLQLDSPVTYYILYDRNITGVSEDGDYEVTGKVLDDVKIGKSELSFLYDPPESLNYQGDCQVGGSSAPTLHGCLKASGVLHLGGSGTPINYTYSPLFDNRNGRRFSKFSTEAEEKMARCKKHCPYADYQKFYNYYNVHHYADEWIRSAFIGLETNFKHGVADFSLLSREGRAGAVQTATAFMSLWMYMIQELEVAVSYCVSECSDDECSTKSVHAWDQAVAFYTGSLGQSGAGNLLYSLANDMCSQFGTCDSEDAYTAKVNAKIFEEFDAGQQDILNGLCHSVKKHKEKIIKLMTIPLVQATLRYAYLLDIENDTREETRGYGGTFAATVLPIVHDCNADDAEIIYQSMRIGRKVVFDFFGVKSALERNYECMGITCEDIGGLFNKTSGDYLAGAASCAVSVKEAINEDRSTKHHKSPGFLAGMAIVGFLVVGVIVHIYKKKFKSDIEYQGESGEELAGRGRDEVVVVGNEMFVEDNMYSANNGYSDFVDDTTSGNAVETSGSVHSDNTHSTQSNGDEFQSVRIEL